MRTYTCPVSGYYSLKIQNMDAPDYRGMGAGGGHWDGFDSNAIYYINAASTTTIASCGGYLAVSSGSYWLSKGDVIGFKSNYDSRAWQWGYLRTAKFYVNYVPIKSK